MARERKSKKGKALHIRGLRQRWMVNSVAPVCVLLILVVIASFVTQAIFGDIPWLRFFFNSFKTIGTESLLQ